MDDLVTMERRSAQIRNLWVDAARAMDEEHMRLHDEIRTLRSEVSVLQNTLAEANHDRVALLAELDAYECVGDPDEDEGEEVLDG